MGFYSKQEPAPDKQAKPKELVPLINTPKPAGNSPSTTEENNLFHLKDIAKILRDAVKRAMIKHNLDLSFAEDLASAIEGIALNEGAPGVPEAIAQLVLDVFPIRYLYDMHVGAKNRADSVERASKVCFSDRDKVSEAFAEDKPLTLIVQEVVRCQLSDEEHRHSILSLLDATTASHSRAAGAVVVDEKSGSCSFLAIIGITTEEEKDEALRRIQRDVPDAEIRTVAKPSLWHLHNDVRKRKDFCIAGDMVLRNATAKEVAAKILDDAKAKKSGHSITMVTRETDGKQAVRKLLGIYLSAEQAKEQHLDPNSSRYCKNVALMEDFSLQSTSKLFAPELDSRFELLAKVTDTIQTSKHFKALLHHADLQIVTSKGLEIIDSVTVSNGDIFVGTVTNKIKWEDLAYSVQQILKQLIALCFASN
jgi:hypothetical protein